MKLKIPGFTFLDAVLGLALLAAGLLGLIYVFQGSVSSSALAGQTLVATNLARETLEKITAQRDCKLSGCGYAATLTSINTDLTYNQSPVSAFPIYTILTTALEVDPDSDGGTDDFLDAQSGSGYARVTVTVSWNNNANSIQLVTLLGSYTR
jgi:type II secretory pathway pseudopilin PulG